MIYKIHKLQKEICGNGNNKRPRFHAEIHMRPTLTAK